MLLWIPELLYSKVSSKFQIVKHGVGMALMCTLTSATPLCTLTLPYRCVQINVPL